MRTDKDTVRFIKNIKNRGTKAEDIVQVFNVDIEDRFKKQKEFDFIWHKLIPMVRYKPTEFITHPFMDAAMRASESLQKESNSFEFKGSGTFLHNPDKVSSSIYFYDIVKQPINNLFYINLMVFQAGALNFYLSGNLNSKGNVTSWVSKTLVNSNVGSIADLPDIEKVARNIQLIILLLMFKKYAKIDEKILKPRDSIKEYNGVYQNNTGVEIRHLNINWWTDIIQSNSFNVRGHFRMQACGINHEDRKIIWINEFKKTGYILKNRKQYASN